MKKGNQSDTAYLRQRAEELLKAKLLKTGMQLSKAETQKLIHELEVHQIELELQNEELILAKALADVATHRYTELYDFAPSGYFTISKEGVIIELNLCGSQMLGVERYELKNSLFGFFVSDDTKPTYNLFLGKVFKSKTKQTCEIILSNKANNLPMYVHLTGMITENREQCLVTIVDITEQKRTQELVEKSNRQKNLILEAAGEGILGIDLEGNLTFINPMAAEILGYCVEELSFKNSHQLFHHHHRDGSIYPPEDCPIYQTLHSGRPAYGEEFFLRKAGTYFPVEFSSLPVIENGKIIGAVVTFRDITEHKQAEEARQKSAEQFHSLYMNMIDGATLSELTYNDQGVPDDYVIIETNPAFEMQLGISCNSFIGKTGREVYGVSEPPFLEIYSQVDQTGEPIVFETYFQPLAKYYSILIYCPYKGRLATIFKDITEKRLAEKEIVQNKERLESSEKRYRLLYENAKIGLYRTTPDGAIVLANKALVTMLGYQSYDELAKRNIEHDGFEIPHQRKAFLETIEQTGEVENFETTWIRQDRTPVFVRESARAIRDSYGNTVYYDGTAEDITQLRHTQDELDWNMALLAAKANSTTPNSSVDAILVVDQQGKKIFQNQRAADLLEVPQYIADEKDDEKELQWVAGLNKDPEKFIERVAHLYSHPYEISRDVLEYKDGTFLDRYTAPVVGKDGKYYGRLWIFRDITERRRTEAALRESEERYRLLFETSADGILIVDLETTTFKYANPALCRMLGYPGEELTTLGIADIHPSQDLLRVIAEFESQVRGEKILAPDIPCLRKDGSIVYADVNTTTITIDGRPCAVGLFRDITERKRAEEALRESKNIIQNIIDNSPSLIYILDLDGKFILANRKLAEVLNSPAEKLLGNTRQLIMPKEFADQHRNNDLQIITTEQASIYEEEILESDGLHTYLTQKFPLFDSEGKIYAVGGISTDITQRKRAEQALIDSEARAHALIDAIPDLIFRLNKQGVYLDYKAAKEDLAFQAESIIGKKNRDITPPEFADLVDEKIRLTLQTGQMQGFEYQLLLPNKGICEFDARMVPCSSDEVIVIVRDVTERKQAEEEIRLKNEQLLRLNAEKDIFFSIIAHDLRSPFSGFLGLTQIMAEELPGLTMAEIQGIALSMRGSANNLFRLLENLLEWATMQQGLIPFEPKEMELSPIINESIFVVLEQAKNKGIEITCDIPDDIAVFADNKMIQTVTRNLISNAVKFTPTGGKVSLLAKVAGDKSVEISVKDSGIGMNPEMVDNLFRLDVQTNRRGTEGEPSTGLGLMLCKEFVEKHGGKLWIESEEGKGSIFYFTIPYKAEPIENRIINNVVSDQETKNRIDSEFLGLKILIVEDDEFSEKIITKGVRIFSREIINARSGVEAVEACRNNPDINLVLMDIEMPKMNGYEATMQIRQFNAGVIIIAQTAFALTGDREKAIAAGCNDYISKPIKKTELVMLIQKYFKK